MRIIGIDIVKGSTAVIHNLKPGLYPFGRYEKPALAKFPEDKNVNGDWLTGIYHKNDGYLAPLVIKQLQELLNAFQMTWQAELMNDYDLKKEGKLDDIYPEDSQKIETLEGKLKSEFDLTTY